MLHMTEDRLQIEIRSKYKTLDKKLNHLSQQQTRTPPQLQYSFYPSVINTTDIKLCEQEMTLVEKGTKYNLHAKHKEWIRNLALEVETTITHLPPPPPPPPPKNQKKKKKNLKQLSKKGREL